MTATIDRHHRIRLDVAWDGDEREVRHVRFECLAPPEAPCHQYPGCGCEEWDVEIHHPDHPMPGHEPVQQEECWKIPWLESFADVYDVVESYDPDLDDITEDDLRDGVIVTSWEGDWLAWSYADPEPRPGIQLAAGGKVHIGYGELAMRTRCGQNVHRRRRQGLTVETSRVHLTPPAVRCRRCYLGSAR